MADSGSGTQYSTIEANARSRVHAGDAYNTNTSTNTNTNNTNYYYIYNIYPSQSGVSPRQSSSPQPLQNEQTGPAPWQGELVDTANVTSPSQSSDSTGLDYDCASLTEENDFMPFPTRPTCQILKPQTSSGGQCIYFLNGAGLARFIVERYVPFMAEGSIRPGKYRGQEGWVVSGRVLTSEDIAKLMRQSRNYERETRVHRHLTSRR